MKPTYDNIDELIEAIGERRGTVRLWVVVAVDEQSVGNGRTKLLPAARIRAEAEVLRDAKASRLATETLKADEFVPHGQSAKDRVKTIERICEANGLNLVHGQRPSVVRV
jgi:hypothetical protein